LESRHYAGFTTRCLWLCDGPIVVRNVRCFLLWL